MRREKGRSVLKKHLRNRKSDENGITFGRGLGRSKFDPRSSMDDPMGPQLESLALEVLAGLIERVTYHYAVNGFCVLRTKARGRREVVTVVGYAAAVSAGERITASGEWVNNRTHGQQFRARFLRTLPPTSAEGIEKYLSSGMIRGIWAGLQIAYVVDLAYNEQNIDKVVALARDANQLFIEAAFLGADANITAERWHLTAR